MSYKIKTAPYSFSVWFAIIAPFFMFGVLALAIPNKELFCVVPLFLLLGACYFWAPRYYLIEDNKITIDRLVGDIVISMTSIKSVEMVKFLSADRIIGSGGLFGYFGVFELDDGKRVNLYCTRLEKVTVITTMDKTIVLSPVDSARFIKLINDMGDSGA